MTFHEAEQRTRRKKQVKRKLHKSSLDAPFAPAHPDQILTFFEWCQLNRISTRTGRRILDDGTGPTVTQLGPKRIGISTGNNALWQRSRARG